MPGTKTLPRLVKAAQEEHRLYPELRLDWE
jgi:hypothetical protein